MYGLTRRLLVTVASNCEVVKGVPVARQLSSSGSGSDIHIPDYKVTRDESADTKRARLLYQSRKRGMLENDLLLGTFVDKYLLGMNNEQLSQYDRLINCPYSDWDIYYWALGSRPTPPEYDNDIMTLLKEHVKNSSKEQRLRQPDLPTKVLNK